MIISECWLYGEKVEPTRKVLSNSSTMIKYYDTLNKEYVSATIYSNYDNPLILNESQDITTEELLIASIIL